MVGKTDWISVCALAIVDAKMHAHSNGYCLPSGFKRKHGKHCIGPLFSVAFSTVSAFHGSVVSAAVTNQYIAALRPRRVLPPSPVACVRPLHFLSRLPQADSSETGRPITH